MLRSRFLDGYGRDRESVHDRRQGGDRLALGGVAFGEIRGGAIARTHTKEIEAKPATLRSPRRRTKPTRVLLRNAAQTQLDDESRCGATFPTI